MHKCNQRKSQSDWVTHVVEMAHLKFVKRLKHMYMYIYWFNIVYPTATLQILTTKIYSVLHCTTQDPSIKFHPNLFITF